MAEWKAPARNYDGVQHEVVRKAIDQKYNDEHDLLSSCYYGKKPYKGYGILDKVTFDTLHGLIFTERDIEFHDENVKQGKPIPEDEYRYALDADGNRVDKYQKAKDIVIAHKSEGLEIGIAKVLPEDKE